MAAKPVFDSGRFLFIRLEDDQGGEIVSERTEGTRQADVSPRHVTAAFATLCLGGKG